MPYYFSEIYILSLLISPQGVHPDNIVKLADCRSKHNETGILDQTILKKIYDCMVRP